MGHWVRIAKRSDICVVPVGMDRFTLAASEREFIFRTLRSHAAIWLLGGCVWMASSIQTDASLQFDRQQASTAISARPPAVHRVRLDPSSDAHIPDGWRRTANGWEHTSQWFSPAKSIDTWISEQESREPAWIRWVLATIRSTPPHWFATFQLFLVAAIILLTSGKRVVV